MSLLGKIAAYFRPVVTFSIDVQEDASLADNEVIIGGTKFDLNQTSQKVKVSGPRDKRTCAHCMPFIGRVFDKDDPQIQVFRAGGMHPRCRHYLVPVGVPGLDREFSKPGNQYVDSLIRQKKAPELKALFGKAKSEMLLDGSAKLKDMYSKDGSIKTLKDLAK